MAHRKYMSQLHRDEKLINFLVWIGIIIFIYNIIKYILFELLTW